MSHLHKKQTFRLRLGQDGFIPMIIFLLIVLAAIIWFVYTRVAHSH